MLVSWSVYMQLTTNDGDYADNNMYCFQCKHKTYFIKVLADKQCVVSGVNWQGVVQQKDVKQMGGRKGWGYSESSVLHFLDLFNHAFLTFSKYFAKYLTCGLHVQFIVLLYANFSFISNHFLYKTAFFALVSRHCSIVCWTCWTYAVCKLKGKLPLPIPFLIPCNSKLMLSVKLSNFSPL